MNSTEKARRNTILLGDIPLEVFMLPDGSYLSSRTGVAAAIDYSYQYVTDFLKGKSLQALPFKGLTTQKITVDGERTRIDGVPLDLARAFWRYWDKQGNEKASALVDACIDEALERRADAAFEIQRTEIERNERLKTRVDGKITHSELTDAIAVYIERHPELSENARKWIYTNTAQAVNLAIFNRKAKALAEDLGVDPKALRDALERKELLYIQQVEDTAARMILLFDTNPVEAIKEAFSRLLIPKQDRSLQQG